MTYNVIKLIYYAFLKLKWGGRLKILSVKTDAIVSKNFSIHLEHGRKNYLFVLFKTKAMLWLDGSYREIEPGTGIFFDRNQVQSYYAPEGGEFNHDFLLFDFDREYERLFFAELPKGVLLTEQIPGELTERLLLVEKEYLRPGLYRNEMLSDLGMVFLYHASRLLQTGEEQDNQNVHFAAFYRLRMELYEKPYLDWTVEMLCEKLCMSRYYFQHLYKSFFGISCIRDLILARIAYAKTLLLSTGFSVREIAEQCGYKNTEHFIRQFQEQTGTSPGRFRQNSGQ